MDDKEWKFRCYACGQIGQGRLEAHEAVCQVKQISDALDKSMEAHIKQASKDLYEGITENYIPTQNNTPPYSLLEKRIQDLCLGYSDSEEGFMEGYKEGFLQAIDILTWFLDGPRRTANDCLEHLKKYAGTNAKI